MKLDKVADFACVCTPDVLHKDPAIALAAKGYHILLEKPMAVGSFKTARCNLAYRNEIFSRRPKLTASLSKRHAIEVMSCLQYVTFYATILPTRNSRN